MTPTPRLPPTAATTTRHRVPAGRTLVEFASEQLREDILAGELSGGDRIPLDAIAQELGMSPIPVREALRMLASEGLVIPLPHRGYIVAPVDVADLDDTYRLRLRLEPLAVELAVPRLVRADVKLLSAELDALDTAFVDGDWPAHREHHRAFHFGIYDRCGSDWLLRFVDMLWQNAERYQRMTTLIEGEPKRRMREQRQILTACRRGDAERASALMYDHLSRAAETLRAYLVRDAQARGEEQLGVG